MAKHHEKEKATKKPFPLVLIIIAILLGLVTVVLYTHKFQGKSAEHRAMELRHDGDHLDYEEPGPKKKVVIIKITSSGFSPKEVRVQANESAVAFINKDSVAHTVVADQKDANGTAMFNTGAIKPGQQISAIEYEKPGTYTYSSPNNPDAKGTIIVEEER